MRGVQGLAGCGCRLGCRGRRQLRGGGLGGGQDGLQQRCGCLRDLQGHGQLYCASLSHKMYGAVCVSCAEGLVCGGCSSTGQVLAGRSQTEGWVEPQRTECVRVQLWECVCVHTQRAVGLWGLQQSMPAARGSCRHGQPWRGARGEGAWLGLENLDPLQWPRRAGRLGGGAHQGW